MVDLDELRKLKSNNNQSEYSYDGTDTLSRYLAKKAEWDSAKVQASPAYSAFQERYYNREIPQINKTELALPKVETVEEKMQRYVSPNYKMTKDELKEARAYAEQLKKDFNSGKFKDDPKAMEKYDLMTNLKNKSTLKGQFAQGIGGSFKPFTDLTAMVNPNIDKEYYDKQSQQYYDAQKTQNPIAYGAGYTAGKLGQYAVGSRIAGGIPGVSAVSSGIGGIIGKGVAKATGGKIATEVAGKVAKNVIGDTLLDIALDTAPEAISNAYKGKTAGEISQEALKNIATNIGYNLGGEALGGIFKAIKTRKLNKQEVEIAEKALEQMDNIQKSALADSVGAKSVKELETSIVKPQIADNLNKEIIDSDIPKLDENIVNKPNLKSIDDVTNKSIAKEVEPLPKLETTPPIDDTLTGDLRRRSYEDTLAKKVGTSKELSDALIDEEALYKVAHNKDTIQKANDILDSGFENAVNEFNKQIETRNPEAIVLGNELANIYIEQGKKDEAVDVVRRMSEALTKSGQFTQAAAIALLKNDPTTAMRYLQRDLDKLNAEGLKKFKGKWKDFNLTDEEFKMFKNIKPGDSEAIKNAFDTVGKRLSKEYPSTLLEKLVEFRRVSWLLNPRTNVRNIISNAFLKPLTDLSYKSSAIMQNAYSIMNKDFKPNQALLVTKNAKNLANDVWNGVKGSLEDTNKYLETGKTLNIDKQVFKEGKPTQVFNNLFPGVLENINAKLGKDNAGIMETLRNVTYDLLDKGDTPFVEKAFKSRLGSYIQAKGIKNVDDVPPEAITLAYQEALRATFKDDTVLSETLSKIKKGLNDAGYGVGEVILPFTKTPANVAMRGIDYSPAGIISTFKKAKNGADANLIIDELGKNLTGTALIALGAFLARKGVITGASPENRKKSAFEKQQGIQPFAVKIGNVYMSYDWAQPAAIPLIIGATIAESEGKSPFETAKKAIYSSGDAWLNISPLQSISDILGGNGSKTENVVNEFIEIPSGFIPSALGSTARVIDTTQRSTFSKGNTIKSQLDTVKSKIPGLSKTLPASYDTWGREIKRDDSTGQAIISQYVNPGKATIYKQSNVDKEINRIYEKLGNENIFPRKAIYTITRNGKDYNLDNKEYSAYQKVMGENSYSDVQAFMQSKAYNKLNDDQKSKIIQNIYDNAKQIADYETLKSLGVNSEKELETKIKKVYLNYSPENVANYFVAKEIIDNTEGKKDFRNKTIPGTVKQNAIKNLVDIGFSQEEAKRVYSKIREKD